MDSIAQTEPDTADSGTDFASAVPRPALLRVILTTEGVKISTDPLFYKQTYQTQELVRASFAQWLSWQQMPALLLL